MLGPLEVLDDHGRPLAVGGGRRRALLGLLLVRANELVTSERLMRELWGETPPPTAPKMVHNGVSALRRSLGLDGRLETRGSAYRLRVEEGERDIDRFEALVAHGRARLARDPGAAEEALREALALWRGEPLADLAYESFAQPEIARLEEARLAAFEARVDASLALGRHAEAVAELEAAVAAEPLRERLHGQLMLALYRCGRQSDALAAYRRARTVLVGRIGVEPGPELRALQAAVLAQDPSLDPAPAAALPPELDGGSPVLAGRESELAALRDLLGTSTLALVHGPAGIGKTRLAAELAREAAGAGSEVAYVSARAAGAEEAVRAAGAASRGVAGSGRPGLLVVDDLDAATPGLQAALAGVAGLVVALQRSPDLPGAAVSLALGPLGEAAVERIARLHLPAAAEIPVEELMAETAGVPREVHLAAAAWARALMARRLAATADRAAAGRGDLRAAEATLAGDYAELRDARAREERYAPAASEPAVCPYAGLAPFDADRAQYFCGRERLVAELVARTAGAGLLAIVGPSGSGKSSALRAGLLPALADGALPGSDGWRQVLMRPGEQPAAALDRALWKAAGARRLVIAVDQFEEAFTACRDADERTAFLDGLVDAAGTGPLVVLAIRADFYGRCTAHPELAALVAANQLLVGPMTREELRRAIVRPAERAGLRVEPALTETLVAEAADEPGGLPLLSTALVELWRERDGPVLRAQAHERTGGVRGAVARLAEDAYRRLSEPEAAAARRILVRLADAGGEIAFVRRRVSPSELDPVALARLTESRLVTVDDGYAEVAHEALLREWPRLRGWLEEDAEGRRTRAHLAAATREWDAGGRDASELYRGARLAAAVEWTAARPGEANALEREFLTAAQEHAGREAERRRRATRRLQAALGVVAVLLAAAVVTGATALSQRSRARRAVVVADAQRLGAESLTDDRIDHGLLLARAGTALDDSVATRSSLLSELVRNPAAVGVLPTMPGRPNDDVISPDGRVLAIEDNESNTLLVDAATRRPAAPMLHADGWLDFSGDGRTLAVTSGGGPELDVDLYDVRTARRISRIDLGPAPHGTDNDAPGALFGPTGRELIVFEQDQAGPDGTPTLLRRYDLERREWAGGWHAYGAHTGRVGRSPDRRWLVVSDARDRTAYELATATLAVRHTLPGDFEVAVDSSGDRVAEGSMRGSVRLYDARTGTGRTLSGSHAGAVNRMGFTADGRTLVTAGLDGVALVWDVPTGTVRDTLAGHHGLITDIALAPDGRTAFTSSLDGTSIAWDLAGDRRFGRPFAGRPPQDTPPPLAIDGNRLIVGEANGDLAVWNTATVRPAGTLGGRLGGGIGALAPSPDGHRLAVVLEAFVPAAHAVSVLDAQTGAPLLRLSGLTDGGSQAVAFSQRYIAAGDFGGDVLTWDARTGAPGPVHVKHAGQEVLSVAFSPDGKLLAATYGPLGTEIHALSDGHLVARLREAPGAVRWVSWSPDGSQLATGDYDGRTRLWSASSWKEIGAPLPGHEGYVLWTGFSPDGRTLATAGTDGTVLLWDVATRERVGSALTVDANQWSAATFTPDGSRLFALGVRGRGVEWPVTAPAWERHACAVAGRALTRREWAAAVPDQPYRKVC